MDVADRRHKRFEEALRRKLDCVVPRFHCRICQHHNEEAGGICYKHTVRPNQRDHRPRRARPEAANHSGSPRPGSVNRKKGSESTVDIDHITGNVLRYREPQRGSRRLKLAIHRFLKTGFCNAVPLAVLVMLGSVLPALRVPPGRVPTDLPSLPFVPLLARLPILKNAHKPAGGIKVDKIPRGYRAAEPEFIKHDSMDQPVAATVGPSLLSTFGSG